MTPHTYQLSRLRHLMKLPVCMMFFLFFFFAHELSAQNLEPRRWTHLPVGMSVVGFGSAAVDGDIFFDPVQRIEDARFDLYTFSTAYIHSFEWLGKTARVDINLPAGSGRWEGLVDGEYQSIRRDGAMDPRIRLSMHLYGSPPLRGDKFVEYRGSHAVNTSIGVAVALRLPVGEYFPEKLINLGGNRFVLTPQLGLLHKRGPWQFELTGSISFFGENREFFGGRTLEQDALWFMQGHVIREFGPRFWGSLSAGYGFDGESSLSGIQQHNEERTRYTAISVGAAISRNQNIKLSFISADTNVLVGTRRNMLMFGWSYGWLH